MDLRKFGEEVSAKEADLRKSGAGPWFLTSLDNPEKAGGVIAGRVCGVANPRVAAKLIVERTHRLANPGEVKAYEADLKQRTDDLAAQTLERKQQFALPRDLQDLVRVAAKSINEKGNK